MMKMNTELFIQEAFYILGKTSNPHKISINAIIKKAGINRSTFYYYYQDKRDLINKLQNEVLKTYFGILKKKSPHDAWITEHFGHFSFPEIYANCHYVESNKETLKIWANDLEFINKFSEIMIDYLKSFSKNETLCIFIAHGTIGYIRNWVNQQDSVPSEEIANNMIQMVKTVLATE